MQFTSITRRVANLGSKKWLPHLRAKKMAETDPNVILLTIGQPDIPTSSALIDIAEKSLREGRTGYSNGRGEPNLLSALAKKYSADCNFEILHENILCFPGTQTALFVSIMGLIEKGDEVLVGDPLYATYEGVIAASGGSLKRVKLKKNDGFRLQANDLERSITKKSKVLLLNNPHNPSGAVLSKQEIKDLLSVCKRHGLWIVSDEVYSSLIFKNISGNKFFSPLCIQDDFDKTVVVSSISKSHAAPGFRSGWAIGPKDFCDSILPLSESMLFGNQPFIADMTTFALNNEHKTSKIMSADYYKRALKLFETLKDSNMIEPIMPQSGMFMLADIRNTGMDSETFVSRLLREEKIAVMPGSSFGDEANTLIRISLTVPDPDIDIACKRILNFINK
jgi:arginine:pyruvate transaminase